MAVMQLLARLPAEYLAACRKSADESPDGDPHWDPPSSDCLDLDRAPAMLARACQPAQFDDVHSDALRRATEGDTEVDLGFLNTYPQAIGPFSPRPTLLSPGAVLRVSALLGEIDFLALTAATPCVQRAGPRSTRAELPTASIWQQGMPPDSRRGKRCLMRQWLRGNGSTPMMETNFPG